MNTRKLCALLLETYFSIEKFRDITISQLVVILERSPLKDLVSGYIVIMEDRKTSMREFVNEYLVEAEDPENRPLFCPLFQSCQISYYKYCPWSSDTQRQGIQDYLTFVSPATKDVWSKIYQLCNVRTFGCFDNNNCLVDVHYNVNGDGNYINHPAWPYNPPWIISFVGDTEVTIKTAQQEDFCVEQSQTWGFLNTEYSLKCFDMETNSNLGTFTITNVGTDENQHLYTFTMPSGNNLMLQASKWPNNYLTR